MGSKVIMVNLPTDPFQQQQQQQQQQHQQIRKKHQRIVKAEKMFIPGLTSTDPVVRANQLEQNIRFLQEQHQIMLAGLHSEIEVLRQKNRDLQFQIVFSKGVTLVQGSPSSDEEHEKHFRFSPGQVNITPLQVEILERNIAELRTNLSEARTKNVYLQNVIDEQKKKIILLEKDKMDSGPSGKKLGKENLTVKQGKQEQEGNAETLNERMEDADRLIRRLRRENEEQRKEIVGLRTSMIKGRSDGRRGDGNNGQHKSYYRNAQAGQANSRFPPLQGHWKYRSNTHYSFESQSGRSLDWERNGCGETEVVGRVSVSSLPYLRDRNPASTSTGYSSPAYGNYQGGNNKRNFYHHRKQDEHRANGRTSRREHNAQHLNHPSNDR